MSKRKRYAAEEIISKLREAEVHLAQGETVGQVVRRLGVSEQTYYRWRREFGGMRVDQAKRLKELERENARLKRLVAEQALDNSILREVDLTPENRTRHRVRESVQVRVKGRGLSKRKRYAAEEIISKLREAEVHLPQGETVGQVVRRLGVSEQTYYRWRREFGGMRVDQAKRLKELERENARLKRLVAEQALDNSILREVASGNF